MTRPPLVHLVACVARKRTAPALAKDLYLSPWFVRARAFVEAGGGPWYILSAEHGLLSPDLVVAPYECTLRTMDAAERRAWARRVADQIAAEGLGRASVVILAGRRYREHLLPFLRELGCSVDVPMEGLGIGQQLAWLGLHR